MKGEVGSAHNSDTCTSAFPEDDGFLPYAAEALCENFPFVSQNNKTMGTQGWRFSKIKNCYTFIKNFLK